MPARPEPVLDPYRTLGLESGASSAEVKRAYRRLAKAFHPDSAGEQAIPRFLAIQAAYEQIRTGRVVLGGSRAARASAAATHTAPGEPWRADPDRARAARERARRAGTGTGPGMRGSGGTTGGTTGAGTTGGRATGGRKSTGTTGSSGSSGAGTRKRATRKATLGSTSYDEARDPADATWSGASWYGPSTGEYWIVNPREYADPRKHGPDYQQRARRPLQGAETGATAAPEPEVVREPDPADRAVPGHGPDASTTAGPPPEFESVRPRADAAGAGARDRRARPTPRWSSTATGSGWADAGDAPDARDARDARRSAPDREATAAAPLRWLGQASDDPVHRLGLALVAWPPIGLATAPLIGDATGCASFGAQCDGADAMLPWLAQAVILGLLLLLPPLTRVLATGAIAVLVALIPVTSLLVAVGATGAPQAAPTLAVLLGVAWLVGVAWALASRVRRPGRGTGAAT